MAAEWGQTVSPRKLQSTPQVNGLQDEIFELNATDFQPPPHPPINYQYHPPPSDYYLGNDHQYHPLVDYYPPSDHQHQPPIYYPPNTYHGQPPNAHAHHISAHSDHFAPTEMHASGQGLQLTFDPQSHGGRSHDTIVPFISPEGDSSTISRIPFSDDFGPNPDAPGMVHALRPGETVRGEEHNLVRVGPTRNVPKPKRRTRLPLATQPVPTMSMTSDPVQLLATTSVPPDKPAHHALASFNEELRDSLRRYVLLVKPMRSKEDSKEIEKIVCNLASKHFPLQACKSQI